MTVTLTLLSVAPTIHEPRVLDAGDKVVALQHLILTPTFYAPTVTTAGAQTVTLDLLSVAPTIHLLSAGRATAPAGASPPPYAVQMTDIYGAVTTSLTLAVAQTITRTINEPDQATFLFPRNAYTTAQVPVLGTAAGQREAQIYRDSDLMFWGPVVSAGTDSSGGAVECACAGVDWYLQKRAIDGARTNRLTNASFESDGSWAASAPVAFTYTTATKALGTRAASMVCNTQGAEAHISQSFVEVAGVIGTYLTVAAWLFVADGLTVYADRPFDGRGLFVEGVEGGIVQDYRSVMIDNDTPKSQWVRVETGIWVPPNRTWTINVRLYCPKGTIYWDAVQVVAMESVSTAGLTGSTTDEVDIARIVDMLVAHAQNTAPGKSDLHLGTHCPPTGKTAAKHYQYADHVQFDRAVAEFVDRGDVADVSVAITPTTRSYTVHPVRKGTDRSSTVTLTYGGNMAKYRLTSDGAGVVTRATVMGDGDGPDREEGEVADATNVGGLILQAISQAPPKTAIYSLEPLAQSVVDAQGAAGVPAIIEADIKPSADLAHTLTTGDLVTVAITDGWVVVAGVYRIVRWHLDCLTSLLTVTLNAEI